MKSMKALQQSINELVCFIEHWISHTALKRFNELQSHCAKNGSDRFFAMIKVIAMKLVKFLIVKTLKLGHMYLISIICMLL